jgi:hypothetical protein
LSSIPSLPLQVFPILYFELITTSALAIGA